MEPADSWDKLAPSVGAGPALLPHVCGLKRVLLECGADPSLNSRKGRVPILFYYRALPCILPSPHGLASGNQHCGPLLLTTAFHFPHGKLTGVIS